MVREVLALLATAMLRFSVANLLQKQETRAWESYMDCGEGVHLCGILVLQSGLGNGVYEHKEPKVHGLWPQNGHYGSSDCVKPAETESPTEVYPCYANGTGQLGFEQHEWTHHGLCSGTKNSKDYFAQVCGISEAPLQVMATARAQGGDVEEVTNAVEKAGYPIWSDYHEDAQVALTTCADNTGSWHIANIKDFPKTCGAIVVV
mmetsp:Transcript_78415/g.155350  ORF Transcript_78415/g.155350 Transcript_78415/m.155350 type:complete len:204 (-) Transcript_78415:107-718(-)